MSSSSERRLSSDGLVRGLGRWDATLLTVGAVIGTGIFITTADIARVLPHEGMILLVWTLGGFLTLAGALTYAELGALYPRAGGMYHFLKEAYGTFWGFLYGWACFLVIMSGGIAALAVAFGEYLGSFVPLFSTQNILFSMPIGGWSWSVSGGQIAGALAILVLTAVNHIGLREGATVQNFLAVFRIGSIVAFVGLAFFVDKPASASVVEALPEINLFAAVGIGMIAALWTYDGWYGATFSAGEMRDPQRTLPFGLVWGTVIVMVLYALINLVYFVALPLDAIAETPRIGETAAAALFGDGGGKLMSFAILVSTFGCLAATILYSPRIYLAMSRDGVFFRSLGVVNPRFHTPGRSLWAQSLWAVALTLSGTYEQIYTYVVFGGLLFHVGTAGAVIVLRRRLPDLERPYRVWGYPWVPLLFILASLLLLANTLVEKPVESLIGLVFIAAGVPAYLWWRRGEKMGNNPRVPVTGGCLCGAIRYESTEPPNLVGFCHCRMCQQAGGNLFIVFADFPGDGFRFTRGEPQYYRSSEIATRGFCPKCGTPISFQYDGSSGPAIMVGTLDHPEDWPPTWEHSGIESKVPWYRINDDLPKTSTEESEFLRQARDRKANS